MEDKYENEEQAPDVFKFVEEARTDQRASKEIKSAPQIKHNSPVRSNSSINYLEDVASFNDELLKVENESTSDFDLNLKNSKKWSSKTKDPESPRTKSFFEDI